MDFLGHSSMTDFHESESAHLPAHPLTRSLGAKMLLDKSLDKLLHFKLLISLCCQLVINLFVEHSFDFFFVAFWKDVKNASFQSKNHRPGNVGSRLFRGFFVLFFCGNMFLDTFRFVSHRFGGRLKH